ncbi:MAG: hypothetical protein ACI4VQ_00850 [Clostridia bacterium]
MRHLMQTKKLQKILASLILIILIMSIFLPTCILASEPTYDPATRRWYTEPEEADKNNTDWKLEDYKISSIQLQYMLEAFPADYDSINEGVRSYNAALTTAKNEGKNLYDALTAANGDANEAYETEMEEHLEQIAEADDGEEDGTFGLLLSPFTSLLIGIADAVNYVLQSALIGDDSTKVTLKRTEADSYISANPPMGGLPVVTIVEEGVDKSAGGLFGTGLIWRNL